VDERFNWQYVPRVRVGVTFKQMTQPQREAEQQMLMAVMSEIAETHVPELATKRMARVADGGLDTLKFGWMGGAERGQPHYYRIQGKNFLIDNTQNDGTPPYGSNCTCS